jgi:hypothetical protein
MMRIRQERLREVAAMAGLANDGDISIGRVAGECVVAASTSYDCPVMLVRREGESFVALLRRLDRSIGRD